MTPGQRLYADQEVRVGRAVLRYQGDANLVLYGPDGPLWATGTTGAPGYFELQHDGNAVIYDAAGTPIWASDTNAPGASLRISLAGLQIVRCDGSIAWEVSTGVELPPVPEHPDPLVGQLRIEGGAYVDDTGPRLPVFLHLGDLIGHGLVRGVDAILPALDQAAAWGYHGIRSWWQLHLTTGKWLRGPTEDGWTPLNDRQRFREILAAAAERGLAWHLAAGGTKGLSEDREKEHFACLSDAIADVGPSHFALIEGSNEARDTFRDPTPAAVAKAIQPIRERFPGILYALSAYTGHEDRVLLDKWTPHWMQHYQVHGYRDGRAHDKIRHIFSLGYDGEGTPTRRLGWQGEPWGPGRIVSAQANHHEIDANVMILGACMAAMARQAWVVMSGPGVVYTDEPLEAMPGIPDVPSVVRRLPQDVMRWPIFSHSGPNKRGQRIHAVRDDARDVREDYAINPSTSQFMAVRYGPPEQRHDFARERVFWDLDVIHEGRWGRVLTGRLS